MKETRLSPRWPLTILAILLASTARVPAYGAEGSFERTLAVTGPVELDVSTGSGHISTSANHPVTVQGTIGRGELRGKVRGGGPLLELETGSGNIQIE